MFAVSIDQRHAFVFAASRGSYRIAAEPAVMAAEAVVRGRVERGVVLPDRQIEPDLLFTRLRALGITVRT